MTKASGRAGNQLPRGWEVTELLYTGQRLAGAAGFYDYGARMYDPAIARFLTLDPVREYMNPDAYVGWNPVMRTDPTGMLTAPDPGGVAGLNSVYGFHISGPPTPELSIGDLISARDFAKTLMMRGLGKGTGGGIGGLAQTLLEGGLAGFLESTGLTPGQAQLGADFLAEFGFEAIMGTDFARVPGASLVLSQLAAAKYGGVGHGALGFIGMADLPGSPDFRAALSEFVQLVATAPILLGGPGIAVDTLAFGLTQIDVNAALASGGIGQSQFAFLSQLNMVGWFTGVAGNVLAGYPGVTLGATVVQGGVFLTVIGATGRPGPIMSHLLGY